MVSSVRERDLRTSSAHQTPFNSLHTPHSTLITPSILFDFLRLPLMADLTAHNPPSPIPLRQLSFNSCIIHISPFFSQLCLSFFPGGFTPPHAAIHSHGAHSGCGLYGLCFFGPYGYLYLPPIQLQLKVSGRFQSGTSMEQRNQRNLIVELEGSSGTGVFHPPDMNRHGPRNKKRGTRKRGGNRKGIENNEERAEGSTSRSLEEEEGPLSQADDYDLLLPSEWPY